MNEGNRDLGLFILIVGGAGVVGGIAAEWPLVWAFLKAYPAEVFTGVMLLVGVFLLLAGLGIRQYDMNNPDHYCADDDRDPREDKR